MVNSNGLSVERRKSRPPTCFIEIDPRMNTANIGSVEESTSEKEPKIETGNDNGVVAVNKRLGRGQVSSGLTCECGVFGAMACGEWPTQRVSEQKLEYDHQLK